MKHRTSTYVALLVAMCLLSSATALARQPGRTTSQSLRESHARPFRSNKLRGNLPRATGRVGVMIELESTPTAQAFASAQAAGPSIQAVRAAETQLAQVDQEQQRLLAPLAGLGATTLYRTQRVYNGIAARVDASQLGALAGLPGVKAVHPLIRYERDLQSSVPLIGAPELWRSAGALPEMTGAGLKVA
ncbi:MAG TPA: hypothetical protein VFX76_01270, partial [Roseiflexaceae bacterium]|nr:hypothetical protein [Roseiflexaceae bacterium]